ncbi:MAG: phosphate-starvation-inducible PsiE family protein [Methanomicrobiales archaeon]|nr:phosphate-starvation-inducible PsiE family protein [Methanomicrobiales archaeon]
MYRDSKEGIRVAAHSPFIEKIVTAISSITTIIYLIIAAVLVILAGLSFIDVIIQAIAINESGDITAGILSVLHTLLLSIIIIELLETVVIYFRTYQFRVQPILFAALTAMIRKVLVYGVEISDFLDILATVAAIGVLTIAIVLIGKEEK